MLVSIPVSVGELADKIAILQIKAAHVPEGDRLNNVRKECGLLMRALHEAVVPKLLPAQAEMLDGLREQLFTVNGRLWRIEDDIRACEARQDFGPEFVALARAVYHTNDHRSDLKRQINALVGSAITEEKQYTAY